MEQADVSVPDHSHRFHQHRSAMLPGILAPVVSALVRIAVRSALVVPLLAACVANDETAGPRTTQRNYRPALSVTAADAGCLLWKTGAIPPPGFNRLVLAPPVFNTECGIRWTMNPALVSITPWGYEFLRPYLPPDNRSTSFYLQTGVIQNGPNYVDFSAPIDLFVSTSVTLDTWNPVPAGTPYPPGPPEQRIIALNDSGRVLIDTVGGAEAIIARANIRTVRLFLRCSIRGTESFPATPDGTIAATPYPFGRTVLAHRAQTRPWTVGPCGVDLTMRCETRIQMPHLVLDKRRRPVAMSGGRPMEASS